MGLSNRQWGNLLKDIERQRCILLLGPRLALGIDQNSEKPLVELLAMHLSEELKAEGIPFDSNASQDLSYIAQRFMTIPKIRRIDLEDEALTFYQKFQSQPHELYQLIARLPFHLIVNSNPDDNILKAFRKEGKLNARQLHYNYRRELDVDFPELSESSPLVYNLLGSLSDPESLVLSQENQVDFIRNVVKGNPPIPNQLMRHFDDRKTYLFLGFNLEKWYFRLMLDSLRLGDKNMTIAPQLDNYPVTPMTQSFYEDRYRFVFVEERIDGFLERLAHDFQQSAPVQKNPGSGKKQKMVLLFDNNENDEYVCRKLSQHLHNLEQQGQLEIWHKGMAAFGVVDQELEEKIAKADIVVPIVSADFFAAEAMHNKELPLMLKAHRSRNIQVLPVLSRPCLYEDSVLSNFSILPLNKQALSNWEQEDEAYQAVVQQIKQLISG